MSWSRGAAIVLSLGLHAGVVYALVAKSNSFALADGKGADDLTVVATVTMENGDLFGVAPQNQEAREATPAAAPAQPQEQPKEEAQKPPKEEEPQPVKQEAAEQPKPAEPEPPKQEDTPPPPEEKPVKQAETPPKPPALARAASAATDAQEEQEAANRALEGRRTRLTSLYQGEIFVALGRHKVNPRSHRTGRVVVLATIAPSGQLVSREVVESSGSDVLDKAAVASLDRSAPFPAMPRDLGGKALTLRVPFEYSTR